jgi:hypothetical protein
LPPLVAFPPEALLILEKRLWERQGVDGWPPWVLS